MYFCVICLLRVCHGPNNLASLHGREMVMVFPYVFEDPRNPLTHWALVNKRQQSHYIVRRNVRQGSAVVPGQELLSSGEESQVPSATATGRDHESCCSSLQRNMRVNNKTCTERVRKKWLKLSVKQREELLRFEDPAIFERTLKNVTALFSDADIAVQMPTQFRGLPLLSSLEFERTCAGPKVVKVSSNVLQDGIAFFATLQQLCPLLCSGKLRRRSNPAEWSALFDTPAREARELQQRIAELIEQRLWVLAEPACKLHGGFGGKPLPSSWSGNGGRRAKKTRKQAVCLDKVSHAKGCGHPCRE